VASAGLTGSQRAVMLVMSLADEQAASLLRNMSESSLAKLRAAADQLDVSKISDAQKREALRTFFVHGRRGGIVLGRPRERFRQALARAKGEEAVRRIYADREPEARKPEDMGALEAIDAAPEEQVAMLVEGESPRCAAALLFQLDGQKAGRIASLIEDEEAREATVERLIVGDRPSPVVAEQVVKAFHARLLEFGPDSSGSEEQRAEELAKMVASLDRESQDRVLNQLREKDPDLADSVEQEMFSFDDLVSVDGRSMQALLRNVEVPLIAMALKGAPKEIQEQFLGNLSVRARERVREEREMAGRVPLSEVESARAEIMKVARNMYRAGELAVAMGDEQYVE